MNCGITINCKLFIDEKYYNKLNVTGKELFLYDENYGLYCSCFPAEGCSEQLLYSCIIAYCEIMLIDFNNIYSINDEVSLSCDIFRLGPSKQYFTLLITITYPDQTEDFHDLMTFEIVSQTSSNFYFKLLGDQTIFSIN